MQQNENSIILKPDDISKKIKLGFEWFRAERERHEIVHDIDLWAMVINKNGKISCDEALVFYNNWTDPDHIVYFTDDQDGRWDEDDSININLNNATNDTDKIIVFADIYAAKERNQDFSQLTEFYMYNNFATGKDTPFVFNNLPPTSVLLLCEIKRNQNEWLFAPTGIGYSGDMNQFLKDYGVNL